MTIPMQPTDLRDVAKLLRADAADAGEDTEITQAVADLFDAAAVTGAAATHDLRAAIDLLARLVAAQLTEATTTGTAA